MAYDYEQVKTAWTKLDARLRLLGFSGDFLNGQFIRGEGDDRIFVTASYNDDNEVWRLEVRGNPDRIIAMLTTPGGDTHADG